MGFEIGVMDGKEMLFVADSESSSIRGMVIETRRAVPIAGAN